MEQLETLTETSRIIPLRWRSLIFDKSGSSYIGVRTFPDHGACIEATNDVVARLRAMKFADFNTLNGLLAIEDYAWHMAIPEII